MTRARLPNLTASSRFRPHATARAILRSRRSQRALNASKCLRRLALIASMRRLVVVIGGIGSVRGALIAALLVGLVDTFGKVLLPSASGMLVYVLMAAVLLWKPEGLFRQ